MVNLQNIKVKANSSFQTVCPFPIGFVYSSMNSTSPASTFGGSWTEIKGRFPYFNAGTSTGGSNTVTLTVEQMPRHGHTAKGYHNVVQMYSGMTSLPCVAWEDSVNDGTGAWSNNTGGGGSHNNMPAYQTLYAWYRTA